MTPVETMANRREFIQTGFAASMLPILATARELMPQPAAPVFPFYKVIFDRRFAASREFGNEMEKLGAAVYGIHGDITDLWYHDLSHRWKQSPAPIAGMTAHGPLFCLERLAWDHEMRVLSRTEHPSVGNSEPLISWIIGPKVRTQS
jgi:hypothetical protein